MPDELFRASHFHNSPPKNSDIVVHAPHFHPHFGGGSKRHKTTYVQAQRGL